MNEQKFNSQSFSLMPVSRRVEKPWGYEIIFTPEHATYTGKILHVNAGKRLSLQYHDEKVESLCLLKGDAVITLSDEHGTQQQISMEREKGYYVVPGQVHRVQAVTDVDFIEASTPETGKTIRLQDDSGRSDETEEMRSDPTRGWKI